MASWQETAPKPALLQSEANTEKAHEGAIPGRDGWGRSNDQPRRAHKQETGETEEAVRQ